MNSLVLVSALFGKAEKSAKLSSILGSTGSTGYISVDYFGQSLHSTILLEIAKCRHL